MGIDDKSELYTALHNVALSTYGDLLAPELANQAAGAFARETADMVQDLLEDGAAVLRERIEAQLESISNGGAKGKKGKPKPKRAPKPEVKAVEPAPEPVEAEVEAPAPTRRRKAKAS